MAAFERAPAFACEFLVNPNWSLLEIPQYGNIDMLLHYDASRGSPKMQQILVEAGGNGSGLKLSPDGRRVVYLSHVGFPLHSNNLPGFNTDDLQEPPVPYAAGAAPAPQDIAFPPSLEVVAVPTGQGAAVFDQEKGRRIDDALLLLEGSLNGMSVERLFFSPEGDSLILQCTGRPTGRQLLQVKLQFDRTVKERRTRLDGKVASRIGHD